MITQGLIIRDHRVLMVKEYADRGDIVWNFPGGSSDGDETCEAACIREVKEETGFDIAIVRLLHEHNGKYSFIADIIGGALSRNRLNEPGIIEIPWIDLHDFEKFDAITLPVLKRYLEEAGLQG